MKTESAGYQFLLLFSGKRANNKPTIEREIASL